MREILEGQELAVEEAENGEAALAWLRGRRAELMITDLMMPKLDGMGLLARLHEVPDPPTTIVITAHGSERHAVEAIKAGAHDYFSKPFDMDQIVQVVERTVRSVCRERENELLRAELGLSRHMVFASEAMRRVAVLVQRAAVRDVTVLVTGPSGVGKERVATAIWAASSRAKKPFVRFNCAAITRELAEAELFGYAKGAFTGSVRSHAGLFREASGGTLLLDEIGSLDLMIQGKLLRTLQEGTIRPVGEGREVPVDVRLVAATNADLRVEVEARRFREDLFWRLNVVEIRVPPLSERPEDIPVLVEHFAQKYADRFGLGPVTLTPSLVHRLTNSPYPGNVRELEHRIERLVALASGPALDDAFLDGFPGDEAGGSAPASLGLRDRVDAFERGIVQDELRRCNGNRSRTARRLGISRITLLEKLKKHRIE